MVDCKPWAIADRSGALSLSTAVKVGISRTANYHKPRAIESWGCSLLERESGVQVCIFIFLELELEGLLAVQLLSWELLPFLPKDIIVLLLVWRPLPRKKISYEAIRLLHCSDIIPYLPETCKLIGVIKTCMVVE